MTVVVEHDDDFVFVVVEVVECFVCYVVGYRVVVDDGYDVVVGVDVGVACYCYVVGV